MKLTERTIKKISEELQSKEMELEQGVLQENQLLSATSGIGTKYFFDRNGYFIKEEPSNDSYDYIVANGIEKRLDEPIGFPPRNDSGVISPSGISFNGSGLCMDIFKFFADNTDVEWAYCYKNGYSGGILTTSNLAHKVDFPSGISGMDSIVHNHSQRGVANNGYTRQQWIEYNSLPSEDDVKYYRSNNLTNAYIYNELDGQCHSFDGDSEWQENYNWD